MQFRLTNMKLSNEDDFILSAFLKKSILVMQLLKIIINKPVAPNKAEV